MRIPLRVKKSSNQKIWVISRGVPWKLSFFLPKLLYNDQGIICVEINLLIQNFNLLHPIIKRIQNLQVVRHYCVLRLLSLFDAFFCLSEIFVKLKIQINHLDFSEAYFRIFCCSELHHILFTFLSFILSCCWKIILWIKSLCLLASLALSFSHNSINYLKL